MAARTAASGVARCPFALALLLLLLLDALGGAAAFKLLRWGARAAGAVGAATLIGSAHPLLVGAATEGAKPLYYKSGKNPVPLDPNNPKVGSKKDSSFLRALSSCKQDCQRPGEGMAKQDCLQDCQDQCCTTYEQCTFKVKKGETEL